MNQSAPTSEHSLKESQICLIAEDEVWLTAVAPHLPHAHLQHLPAGQLPNPILPDTLIIYVLSETDIPAHHHDSLAMLAEQAPLLLLVPAHLETAVLPWIPRCAHSTLLHTELSQPLLRQAMRHARHLFHSQQQTRKLQIANYQLTAMWQNANDAMSLSDPNGIVTAANPAYLQLYSLKEADVIGQNFSIIFPPEQREWANQQYHQVFHAPQPPAAYESTVIRSNGEQRTVESRIGFIEQDGQRTAMLSIVRDVTERRQREEFATEVADRIPALIAVRDVIARRWIYMNNIVGSMLGIDKNVLLGMDEAQFFEMVHPDSRQALHQHIERVLALADGETTEQVFRLRDGYGRYRLLHTRAAVLTRDDNGRPLTQIGVTNDITQQDEAEKALRASEAHTRAVMASAAALTIIINPDYTISAASGQIASVPPNWQQAIVGYNILDLITDPNVRRQGEALLPTAFAGEQANLLFTQDNYSWDCRLSPLRDDQDTITHAIIVAVDVTEQQRIARELQDREAFIRHIAEAVPAILYVFSHAEQRNIYANREIAQVLGYTTDEIVSMGNQMLPRLLHPDDWHSTRQAWETLAHGEPGEVVVREFRMRHRDGSYRWLLGRESVLRWLDDGRIDQILGVVYDNTDRRNAEETLRQLSHVVEQSPISVIVTNRDGTIQYVNARFEETTGYNRAEAIGQTPRILKSGQQPPTFYADMWNTILAGAEWRGELLNQRKDGSSYWATLMISPLVDGNGNISHFTAVQQDITEQKRIQEQMQQHERLAAVGQLAAGIAHDFNNILAVITLYTQLVRETAKLDDKAIARLETVLKQAQRASNLIQQILDFSRQSIMKKQQLHIVKAVQETMNLMSRTLPENIVIRLVVADERPSWHINADPTRLQQLLMNLCVNARDAMPGGGLLQITISSLHLHGDMVAERPFPAMAPGNWVVIKVTDSGEGMSKEVQSHIFDPFFTTKAPGKGVGLGLAQVYGIVQQHNGFIRVESTQGTGTSFYIYFPEMAPTHDDLPAHVPNTFVRGNQETILLVEDDTLTQQALVESLELLGYRVVATSNGEEALHTLTHMPNQIDLILTDFMMPHMDGHHLLQTLHQTGYTLPVVMLTGHMLEAEMQTLRQNGLAAWLMKPPSLAQLAETLAAVLHHSDSDAA